MDPIELVGAVIVLVAIGSLGVICHELLHAVVLALFGIPYEIEWSFLTDRDHSRMSIGTAWATVNPKEMPSNTPTWSLQLSAIAPLCMALPFLFVLVGVIPDPVATNSPPYIAATVAWLGCALPSPQDFAVFWYPDETIRERTH